MQPQTGRSSLLGISTISFYLQLIFRSPEDVGNKTNSQALSSSLQSLTLPESVPPSCSCPLIYALILGSSNPFHRFGSTLTPHSLPYSSLASTLRISQFQYFLTLHQFYSSTSFPLPNTSPAVLLLPPLQTSYSSSSYVASPPAQEVSTATCLHHMSYFQALPHAPSLLLQADHHHW